MDYYTLGFIFYWTFAVAAVAIISIVMSLDNPSFSVKSLLLCLLLSVLWPFSVIAAIPIFVYQATVVSAKQIRADLRNRKLLREFESWLKSRKD